MKISRRVAEIEGGVVHYQVAGQGDPLVLVHGLAGSSLWWSRNLPALAKHYTVYLVDLPGFGAMRWPRGDFVLADATSWLARWMDAVGLTRSHLAGHSMGGRISLRLAARHPERIDRLVLVAPAVHLATRSVLGHFAPVIRSGRRGDPRFFPILAYDSLRAGPLTLLRAARQLVTEDVKEDLKSIATPTLLVWGSQDAVVPTRGARVLRRTIPTSTLLVLEGASHVAMYDRPREFNAAMLDFLAGRSVGE